jgi:hypothetical protein
MCKLTKRTERTCLSMENCLPTAAGAVYSPHCSSLFLIARRSTLGLELQTWSIFPLVHASTGLPTTATCFLNVLRSAESHTLALDPRSSCPQGTGERPWPMHVHTTGQTPAFHCMPMATARIPRWWCVHFCRTGRAAGFGGGERVYERDWKGH